jgi:molecular chaperone GrpE
MSDENGPSDIEREFRNRFDPASGDPEGGDPSHRAERHEEANAAAEASAGDPAEARIASLEAELASLKDQLLRALAEAENSRRRARREAEDTAKYAVTSLAKDLVSAPDNLRRVLENIPAEGRKADELLDRLATGVEMVEREIQSILERHGVKRLEPLGQPFDHNFHQALYELPSAEHPPGTVLEVLAPGYVIHDRLLRPAMVAVAKAPPEGRKEAEEPDGSGSGRGFGGLYGERVDRA